MWRSELTVVTNAANSISDDPEPRGRCIKSAAVIAIAAALFYLNSFEGAFVYDEDYLITNNYAIRHLWPPWRALFNSANANRPLIGLSNALNYAVSGLHPWSYHALNLIIHTLAALALFGVVRRTLLTDRLRDRFGKHSITLATIVALIWAVHPLQTESVTYVVQRCESLMGMFYLLTLYCFIRSLDGKGLWSVAAVAACIAGMLSKEVMVTAPALVLLYDYVFVPGSLKQKVAKRWRLYAGLIASLIILGVILEAAPASRSAGLGLKAISPLRYLTSEFGVIFYYLRLSVWPTGLCLDYLDWPKATTAVQIVGYGAVLVGLGAVTIWAVARRMAAGFAGAWFFLILSVTSSIVPIQDLVSEHRMYLPLASLIAFAVLGGYRIGIRLTRRLSPGIVLDAGQARRMALVAVAIVVGLLGLMTVRRNIDYKSWTVMWIDAVTKRPGNPRAHTNLGWGLMGQNRVEEAIGQFTEALRLDPNSEPAHCDMGSALLMQGKLDEGKLHLIRAIQIFPDDQNAHFNLGGILATQHDLDGAIQELAEAVRINPDFAEAHMELGYAMEMKGMTAEAKNQYLAAIQLRPDWSEKVRTHIAAIP